MDFPIYSLTNIEEIVHRLEGRNRKHLLIVLEKRGDSPPSSDFLGKILGAIGYDILQDVAQVELAPAEGFSLSVLQSRLPIKDVVVFGKPPQALGLKWKYKPYVSIARNGQQYLFADSLSKIESDKALKRTLWTALQAMFTLKKGEE